MKLRNFLYKQNKKKFWGEYFDTSSQYGMDEWNRRKSTWNNYDIKDFIIAKDEAGEIIFSTLPWAPKKTRKLVIEKITFIYGLFGKIFKLVGKKEIKTNIPLNNYYLTHFEISHDLNQLDKKEIFTNFLNHLYKTNFQREYHSVIFCDYYDKAIEEVLQDYIVVKTPARLYQILPKHDQENRIKITDEMLPQMTFEAAIV